MLASASGFVSLAMSAVSAVLQKPGVAIALCYAAGLTVDLSAVGDGQGGAPFSLAAPAVVGMILRVRHDLKPSDAFRLACVHVAVAALAGQALAAVAVMLAHNLAWIVGATLAFGRLRAAGFISSQCRTVAAAALVTAAGAGISGAIDACLLAGDGRWIETVAMRWIAAAVSAGLLLMVMLTFDRDDSSIGAEDGDETRPGLWEHAAAGALVAVLLVGSIATDIQEGALAASVALLWFALRLGLRPTALAAFSFATVLLVFGGGVRWPAMLGATGPVEAELLRHTAIALLAAPSLFVAAAVHDHRRARRIYLHKAMHDELTKLANRARFLDVIGRASMAAGEGGRRFALLLIDLDHFKSVNDTFGHAGGDELLVEISARLRMSLRATDLVARIGGDEFAVVAPIRTVDDAMRLAKRLVETVNQRCELNGVSYTPSITVGGVLAPDSSSDPRRLMVLADDALYQAKAAGRNCWRFTMADAEESVGLPIWGFGDAAPQPQTVYLD